MLVGVATLPPLFPPSRNIGILHYKNAKLRKHLQHSVYVLVSDKVFPDKKIGTYFGGSFKIEFVNFTLILYVG